MGKDFTGYGEIRIKRVPEELKALLRAEAKRLGMDERGVMLMRLWGANSTPYEGAYRPPVGTNSTPIGTPNRPSNKDEKSSAERVGGFELPEWVPREAWGHFEEVRRKMRKPLTEAAKKTAVGVLEKLKARGQDPEAVLEQSVYRGWQGLFEVDGGGSGGAGGNGYVRKTAGQLRSERLDALFAEVEERDSKADGEDSAPGHGKRGS